MKQKQGGDNDKNSRKNQVNQGPSSVNRGSSLSSLLMPTVVLILYVTILQLLSLSLMVKLLRLIIWRNEAPLEFVLSQGSRRLGHLFQSIGLGFGV